MRNDRDNVFKGLQQSLEGLKGQLHFLETSVPVDKQMEYFRYSENVRNDTLPTSIEEQIEVLLSPESSPKELKYALAYLAVSGDIKAYRTIESYSKGHGDDWTMMSLVQAKITLESELTDEKKIFISTGLGGKGDKLRFSAFFKANHLRSFSNYQRELVEKEMSYAIEQHGGEVEEVKIAENYFTILFLINIDVNIKALFENATNECNQYGNFINSSFIITNVKLFSEEDIRRELQYK
ncbi:MAG: hypothetical protein LBR97_04290 [Dysgonamonadaceae bacterium]|jgi:hypothetical protein|nr:hypothetical protein [Dysgonamonadaceae bacterium]